MRFRRAAYIFNPTSGSGTGASRVREVRKILLSSAREVVLAPTEAPNHASALAREAAAAGSDLIAVQGGDGTVNEAVQGLAGNESSSLLVLPGGTANVLIKETGMPTDPALVASMLPSLERRTIRLGLVEPVRGGSRYFLLMCGAGLDAEIAARTATHWKRRLGPTAFWVQGARQAVRRFPRLTVGCGGRGKRAGPTSLVVISKSRMYGGGLVLTPRARLLADALEVALFAGTSRFHYTGYLLAIVCGLTSVCPGVRHRSSRELTLSPLDGGPVQWQVDGEVAGTLPARVSLSSASLSLLLPADYGAVAERRQTRSQSRGVRGLSSSIGRASAKAWTSAVEMLPAQLGERDGN